MKLYYHHLSGHSHRVRLFLSLLGVKYEAIEVDLAAGAHKSPEYLKLNRFGQVPVLVDGSDVIADSNAILVYLARKLGRPTGCRKRHWRPRPCSAGCPSPPVKSPMAPPPHG